MPITENTADVTGTINNQSGGSIFLVWDLSDKGGNINDWANSVDLGILPDGAFNHQLTGLLSGTNYFVRAYTILDDGGVAFTPAQTFQTVTPDIPDVPASFTAWYEADVGVTHIANAISQWDDQSGNNHHMTQTGADILKPMLRNDIDNTPYIDLQKNESGYLEIPATIDLDARNCSFFVVASRSADVSGGGYEDQSYLIGFGAAAADIGLQHGQDAARNLFQGFDGAQLTTNLNGQNLENFLGTISDASNMTIYQGSKSSITAPQPGIDLSMQGGRFGNHGSVTTLPWRGAVRAVYIADSAISGADLTQLKLRITTKWNLAKTNTIQIAFVGDSITSGTGAEEADSYPNQVLRLRQGDFDGLNVSLPGGGIVNTNTERSQHADPALDATTYTTHQILVMLLGTNNLSQGETAANLLTNLQTAVSAAQTAGWDKVLVGTITPQAGITAGEETQRNTLNTSIRTNTGSWHDGVVDFDGDVRLQDETDLTYFNADQVHPNATGYQVMAEIANTAITAALP